jgi:hypothetical protein
VLSYMVRMEQIVPLKKSLMIAVYEIRVKATLCQEHQDETASVLT